MADPLEVDDEASPGADDPLRRQVEATLRFMALTTVIGLVVIAILAVLLSGARGVMILVGIVYLVTSVTAYWYLRRTLNARLKRAALPASDS
jgi:ABC-type bacteriocin/lantibiotic exporter with double-glycine peptidase domain